MLPKLSSIIQQDYGDGLRRALKESFKLGASEIPFKYLSFISSIISNSAQERNLPLFANYIFYFWDFYRYSKVNPAIQKDIVHEISVDYKSLVAHNIGYNFDSAKTIQEKEHLNQFIYWSYFSMLTFLHSLLDDLDQEQLKKAFSEVNKIVQHFHRNNNISQLRNRNFADSGENNALLHEIRIETFIDEVHRHSMLALYYWTYFLYDIKMASKEKVELRTSFIKLPSQKIEDLFNDLSILREKVTEGYLGLEGWDFMDRTGMNVYSPPDAADWVTKGTVIFLLKKNYSGSIDIEKVENNRNYYFIYDTIKEYFSDTTNFYDKWNAIIDCKSIEQLQLRFNWILNVFKQLKDRYIFSMELEIAEQPLEEKFTLAFKTSVFESWISSIKSIKLFEHFGNMRDAKEDEQPEDLGGVLNLKAKSNFIEKGYQQIHLIEDLGSKIANKNDEEFISKVLKDTPTLEYGLIYDAVYDMIQKLKNTGFKPSVIFTDSIAAYDDSIEESSYFIPYWKYMDKKIQVDTSGYFDEIPVIPIYSDSIENIIIACDFEKAFELSVVKNSDWFNNILKIEIKAVDREMAKKSFESDKEGWLAEWNDINISEEKAIVRLMNYVQISGIVHGKFNICNSEAFLVGKIIKDED